MVTASRCATVGPGLFLGKGGTGWRRQGGIDRARPRSTRFEQVRPPNHRSQPTAAGAIMSRRG